MPITWQNINAPKLDTSFITNAANLMNKGMNQGQQLVEGEIDERQNSALQNLRQQAYQDPNLTQEGLNSLIGSSGLDAQRQQQALDFGSQLIRQNAGDERKIVEQGQADQKFQNSLELFKQQTALKGLQTDSAAIDVTNKQAQRDDYLKKKADENVMETIKSDFLNMGEASDDQLFVRKQELRKQYPDLAQKIDKEFDNELAVRKELDPTLTKHRTEATAAIQQVTEEQKIPLIEEAAQQKKYLDTSPYTAAEKLLENSSLSNVINKNYSGDSGWFMNSYLGAGDNLQKTMRDKSVDPEIIKNIQDDLRTTLTESSNLTPKQIDEEVAKYKKIPEAVLLSSLQQLSFDKEDKLVRTTGIDKVIRANALDYFSYRTRSAQAVDRIREINKTIAGLDINAKNSKMAIEKQLRAQQNNLNKLRIR